MLLEKITNKLSSLTFILCIILSLVLTVIEVYYITNVDYNEIIGLFICNSLLLIFIFTFISSYSNKGDDNENV